MSTLLSIKPTKWDYKTSALITGCSNEEDTNNAASNEDEQFDLFCWWYETGTLNFSGVAKKLMDVTTKGQSLFYCKHSHSLTSSQS